MNSEVPIDKKSVVLVVRPVGENRFACGVDSNYKEDTEEKKMCYTVALGLCQIALDDPDMVYEIGLSVRDINDKIQKNGKDNKTGNVVDIKEWRKKLN